MTKTNPYSLKAVIVAILLLVIVFIIFLSGKKTTSKDDLAKFYKISKPTLSNWIKYLHPHISSLLWKSMRRLTDKDVASIKNIFGDDPSLVLNKKQICERVDSDYKTLAANVKMNLPQIGITQEAWDSISVFPPAITSKIIDMMGEASYDKFDEAEEKIGIAQPDVINPAQKPTL